MPLPRVVLLDNHDSFTWILADLLESAAQRAGIRWVLDVVRNTDAAIRDLLDHPPHALVVSPGPNAPEDAGLLLPLLRATVGTLPILGVCLGHQALAQALGGQVTRAGEPMHGRQSVLHHDRRGLFAQLPEPTTVMRYHSLAVARADVPPSLEVTAWLADGTVMGLRSAALRVESVQFHPESVGTPLGHVWADAAVRWLLTP